MTQSFADIDRIRAFNRFYTGHLGLLQSNFLNSGLSLVEARLLFDIGAAMGAGPSARELAASLDMDEGQVSRCLKKIETQGWILRRRAAQDGRRSEIALTEVGRAQWEALVDLSRHAVQDQLGHLGAAAVAELAAEMERIAATLRPDPQAVALRDIEHGDAGWLVQRHGELYARDEGFDFTFEALVAEILAGFLRSHDSERERAFIAHRGTVRLGSIFCVQGAAPDIAKLRLFLLEPSARGQGLGHRLLQACLGFARQAGYRKMTLWTHESHRAACALYRKHGFTMVDSRPVTSFGQSLVEQSYEIEL